MTLKDALATGLPIRRLIHTFGPEYGFVKYGYIFWKQEYLHFEYNGTIKPLTIDDVISDDWIVQSQKHPIFIPSPITYNGKPLYEKVENEA